MLELIRPDAGDVAMKREDDPRIGQLMDGQARIVSMLLAQQAELSRLTKALATVRVSRAQELAISGAIRKRAAQLAQSEGLPSDAGKRIAAAIRTTLREATGARAMGDLQAAQFDRAMEIATTWRMEGALRRIRREVQQHEQAKNP